MYTHLQFDPDVLLREFPKGRIIRGRFPNYVNDEFRFSFFIDGNDGGWIEFMGNNTGDYDVSHSNSEGGLLARVVVAEDVVTASIHGPLGVSGYICRDV